MNFDMNPSMGFPDLYGKVNNQFSSFNPIIMFTLLILLVFYYIVFSNFSVSPSSGIMKTTETASTGISTMELLVWALLIFLVLINGLQYFFSLDIQAAIKNIFSPVPEIDITVDEKDEDLEPVPEIMYKKQVFNVPENEYTYTDAQALCKAYDARLATYEEIEEAYDGGAEWCNYGWSKDQMALYPTQKKTYDKLQKIKGHENDCGRPGINGGFINNKNVRYGVNCFGYKPEITQEEQTLMTETPHYPISKKDKELEKKVSNYRKNLPSILVSPFNKGRWSQI